MAQKIPRAALIPALNTVAVLALLAVPASAKFSQDRVLVNYSFDDHELVPGPQTFSIFENGKGRVRLTSRFSFSGYRSLEIVDVSGDQDFPELQGYFPERKTGKLYLRFALMTPTPMESFNIALAGPQGFSLKKDGISFWISSKNGALFHTTDSIPTKLFDIRAYTWYVFKVIYDIDAGSYRLDVAVEGSSAPVVQLRKQANAPNQPKAVINKFSFIGDKGEDDSNVTYYVDDILVGYDEQISEIPFMAPAQKSLAIDGWKDLVKLVEVQPGCLPLFDLEELGMDSSDKAELKVSGHLEELKDALLKGEVPTGPETGLTPRVFEKFKATQKWMQGCKLLKNRQGTEAEKSFRAALALSPSAKLYSLNLALALGLQEHWAKADELIRSVQPEWVDDPRFDIALAQLGMARKQLSSAAQILEKHSASLVDDLNDPAVQELWSGKTSREVIEKVKANFPNRWQEILSRPLIAEQYFYLLLSQGSFTRALLFAERLSLQIKRVTGKVGTWNLAEADAWFHSGKLQKALDLYLSFVGAGGEISPTVLFGRIADCYSKLGDLEKERTYRRKLYESTENRKK